MIPFNEDAPTVADQPVPSPTESARNDDGLLGLSTLNQPLPVAQFDLHGEAIPPEKPTKTAVEVVAEPEPEGTNSVQVLDGQFLAQIRQERGMSLDELTGTHGYLFVT